MSLSLRYRLQALIEGLKIICIPKPEFGGMSIDSEWFTAASDLLMNPEIEWRLYNE